MTKNKIKKSISLKDLKHQPYNINSLKKEILHLTDSEINRLFLKESRTITQAILYFILAKKKSGEELFKYFSYYLKIQKLDLSFKEYRAIINILNIYCIDKKDRIELIKISNILKDKNFYKHIEQIKDKELIVYIKVNYF